MPEHVNIRVPPILHRKTDLGNGGEEMACSVPDIPCVELLVLSVQK